MYHQLGTSLSSGFIANNSNDKDDINDSQKNIQLLIWLKNNVMLSAEYQR
jgi:hypothetical protein